MKPTSNFVSYADAFFVAFQDDERVKGAAGIADLTADTFEKAKEVENVNVRINFLSMIFKQMEAYDSRNEVPDEFEYSEDELESMFMSKIIAMLGRNESLALLVGKEAIAALVQHPEAMAELRQTMTAHEGLLE